MSCNIKHILLTPNSSDSSKLDEVKQELKYLLKEISNNCDNSTTILKNIEVSSLDLNKNGLQVVGNKLKLNVDDKTLKFNGEKLSVADIPFKFDSTNVISGSGLKTNLNKLSLDYNFGNTPFTLDSNNTLQFNVDPPLSKLNNTLSLNIDNDTLKKDGEDKLIVNQPYITKIANSKYIFAPEGTHDASIFKTSGGIDLSSHGILNLSGNSRIFVDNKSISTKEQCSCPPGTKYMLVTDIHGHVGVVQVPSILTDSDRIEELFNNYTTLKTNYDNLLNKHNNLCKATQLYLPSDKNDFTGCEIDDIIKNKANLVGSSSNTDCSNYNPDPTSDNTDCSSSGSSSGVTASACASSSGASAHASTGSNC